LLVEVYLTFLKKAMGFLNFYNFFGGETLGSSPRVTMCLSSPRVTMKPIILGLDPRTGGDDGPVTEGDDGPVITEGDDGLVITGGDDVPLITGG
jgi:hypothetical protein